MQKYLSLHHGADSHRRLQKALLDPQLEEDMNIEDEVLNEFHKKDEQIAAIAHMSEAAVQEALEESHSGV